MSEDKNNKWKSLLWILPIVLIVNMSLFFVCYKYISFSSIENIIISGWMIVAGNIGLATMLQ